jgi:hypothetical protein
LSGTPTASHVGVHNNITVGVSDGTATASLGPFNITVVAIAPPPPPPPPPPANSAPTISGNPGTTVTENQPYSFTPSAHDADGDALTFTIINRPSWATFNGTTGRLSGTPSASHVGVHNNITIRVSDGNATASLTSFSVTVVAVPPPNSPPTISGVPPTAATENQAYAFAPSANDADGNPLTFTITNRPSWTTFNSTTGRLSGTPSASHVGVHSNITIRVSDGAATASLPSFSITVAAAPIPNRPPTIAGIPTTSVMVDQAYAFTPSADDEDDDPLAFTISNRPSWAAFDSTTGRLSGTPHAGDVATYSNIVIHVSDGEATTSLAAFSIQVVATATGSATLSWIPPTTNTDGSTLTNLAGYKIYWGRSQDTLTNSVQINAGLTSYVVDELTPATWYFAIAALNTQGVESARSNIASKTVVP